LSLSLSVQMIAHFATAPGRKTLSFRLGIK
jgi:hypothetical protein